MKLFCRIVAQFVLMVFLLTIPSILIAQERARIALTPLAPIGDDPQLQPIASTVSESVRTVLRLLKGYQLFSVPEELGSRMNPAALALELGVENVVFGTVSKNDRAVEIRLGVYNREEDRVTVDDHASANSIFDIFDEADRLTAAVIGGFTGERMGFGRISFKPDSGELQYTVVIDGERFSENLTEIDPAPAGEHQIEVFQSRPFGEEVLVNGFFEVIENATTTISIPVSEFTAMERGRFAAARGEEFRELVSTGTFDPGLSNTLLEQFVSWDPGYDRYRSTINHMVVIEGFEDRTLDAPGSPVPGAGSSSARFTIESLIRDFYDGSAVKPPFASITIDGDVGEWEKQGVLSYPVSQLGSKGSNSIVEWSLAQDEKYLYFRIRYSAPLRANELRYRTLIMQTMREKIDGDLELDFSGGAGGEPMVFRVNNSTWTKPSSGHGYRVASGGHNAEYRILLSYLPKSPTIQIRPYIRDHSPGVGGEIHSPKALTISTNVLEALIRER